MSCRRASLPGDWTSRLGQPATGEANAKTIIYIYIYI